MILFLNFAPLEYLGGAERKTYELFEELRKKEKVVVLTADHTIAGAYGKLVLNQPFEDRSKGSLHFEKGEREYITLRSFIPWTKEWNMVMRSMHDARRIYIKCDLNELLILLYFGGLKTFAKTVASVRSPWFYRTPVSFMDRFHNFVYMSPLMKFFLGRLHAIHVLTNRDKELFSSSFGITTTVIPNFADSAVQASRHQTKKERVEVIFIGELILRKGIDTVLSVVKNAPYKYRFHIIGDGPLKSEVEAVSREYKNCIYHGYLPKKEVYTLLGNSDVLFFPSRAEGFGGVILEAMAQGLPVITSQEIKLSLPEDIEYVIPSRDPSEIIETLQQVSTDLASGKINRKRIIEYSKKYFDAKKIIKSVSDALLSDIET